MWTTVDIGDEILADDESLGKIGSLGKLISSNRFAFVVLALTLMLIGAFTLFYTAYAVLAVSIRVVAAGFEYGPGQDVLPIDSVKLDSGIVVARVIEPIMEMQDVLHASLWLHTMAQYKNASYPTKEDYMSGYLKWKVSEIEPEHNFTLKAAKELVASVSKGEPCYCYAGLGLPYNIVYLVESEDVMYGPAVEGELQSAERVSSSHNKKVFDLLARAEEELRREEDDRTPSEAKAEAHKCASKGRVTYLTEGGLKRRRVLEEKEFPCVSRCISLFV